MSSKQLPEGWCWTKIGKIVELEYGKGLPKKSRNENGPFPVYGSNGIVGYHDDYLIEGPVLIIGRKGAAGEVCYSEKNCWPIDTTYFVNPSKDLNLNFIFYLLKSLNLSQYDRSTAIPGLNRNDAYILDIKLPPLLDQHQIVARLEELFSDLDDGIASLKKAQEQLTTYRQAVLKYAFEGKLTAEWRKQHQPESAETLLEQIKTERGQQYQRKLDEWQQTCEQATAAGKKKPPKPKKPKDLPPLTEAELSESPELPKGWCWVRLGAIINDGPSNGYSPRSGKDAKGTKSLKLTATTSRKLILNDSTIKWLYEKIDKNSKYWLKDGDILIQRANTLEYLGATAIYKGKPNEYIYPDLMMRIRIKNDITTRYTWHFCNSLFGRIYFRSNATGIAGNMPKISGATLINLLIPIPNIKEQHQIVQEIESRLSVCDQLEQTITDSFQKAESLRQSILKQAFEGKLTEPWRKAHPNLISGEHSAAALLERIRTEKEKLTSKKQ